MVLDVGGGERIRAIGGALKCPFNHQRRVAVYTKVGFSQPHGDYAIHVKSITTGPI